MSISTGHQGAMALNELSVADSHRTSSPAELSMIWSVIGGVATICLLANLAYQITSLKDLSPLVGRVAWHVWPFAVTWLVAFWSQRSRSAGWVSLLATVVAGVIGIGILALANQPEPLPNWLSAITERFKLEWLVRSAPILQIAASAPLLLGALARARLAGPAKKNTMA